ncbi:CCA-adding enzyme [compost metagenome]
MLLLLLLKTPTDVVRAALQELKFSRADSDAVGIVLSLHQWLTEHLTSADGAAEATALDPSRVGRIWKLGAVKHGIPAAKDWLLVMRAAAAPQLSGRPRSVPDEDLADPTEWIGFGQPEVSLLLERGQGWLEEMPVSTLKELALSGHDLVKHFDKPAGPWLGSFLQALMERVALGELLNDQQELLAAAELLTSNN